MLIVFICLLQTMYFKPYSIFTFMFKLSDIICGVHQSVQMSRKYSLNVRYDLIRVKVCANHIIYIHTYQLPKCAFSVQGQPTDSLYPRNIIMTIGEAENYTRITLPGIHSQPLEYRSCILIQNVSCGMYVSRALCGYKKKQKKKKNK